MAIEKTPRLGLPKYTSGSDLHPNRTEFNALQDLLEAQVAISAQGTLAERPSAGVKNRVYWATDTARPYFDDGKQWLDINPNGGGGAGTDVVVAGTATEGASARAARADHTHNLPLATGTKDGALKAADKAMLDAATNIPTANTLAKRTSAGHLDSPAPTTGSHVANKGYVDEQVAKKSDLGHKHNADDVNAGVLAPARLPSATQSAQGAMSAADKAKLDGATAGATNGTIAQRNSAGQIAVGAPTSTTHAATRGYVDDQVARRVEYVGNLGASHIDTVTARGIYFQTSAAATTSSKGYPIDGSAGSLSVVPFGGANWVFQEWTEWGSNRRWLRSTNDGGTTWRGWIEQASTATATSLADGLLSKVDKAKLDAATSSATAGTLVSRNSGGDAAFRRVIVADAPTSNDQATRKDYVDAEVAKRALTQHKHTLADVTTAVLADSDILDDIKTSGFYSQTQNVKAVAANNYPVPYAGLLEVRYVDSNFTYQRYTTYRGSDRVFWRAYYSGTWSEWQEATKEGHKHNGADITSGTISPDRIANATTTQDGLMPKGDRAALSSATSATTGGTLVKRSPDGYFTVADPTVAIHAANKAYVDAEVAKKSNTDHKHTAADITSGTISPDRIANASSTLDGLMSKADKSKLDAATMTGAAGTIAMRDGNGNLNTATPTSTGHAANKAYVDTQVGAKANSSHKHSVADLTAGNLAMTHLRLSSTTDASETSTGHAFQIGPDNGNNLIIDNNEIIGRKAGALELVSFPSGIWGLPAPATGSTATNKDYVDTTANGVRTDLGKRLDPLEAQHVEHFLSPVMTGAERPAGAPIKHFAGWVNRSTGAGGQNPNATPCTDALGYGGVWFGQDGVPKFSGISYASVQMRNVDGYHASVVLDDITLTRIRYRGRKLDGSNWANAYGNAPIYVEVWGW